MHRQYRLLLIMLALVVAQIVSMPASVQARQLCFDQPGISECISGRFLDYWEENGGLAVFGYPTSPTRDEPNRDTGQTSLTQWFERARFEAHPKNKPPYDVLLGRIGDDRLRQIGVDWQALPRASGPQAGCLWFPETAHNVCDQQSGSGFRSFWQQHGLADPTLSPYQRSQALFGLPLTEARPEPTITGAHVITQWFERGRFEWHPGNPTEYTVLLALLPIEARRIDPVLVGAGDIAVCDGDGDEATAALLDTILGTVFTAGDNAYPDGAAADFRDCYDPSWGRHKARTRPAPGNHEYQTSGASGYFEYFGAAAGEPDKGYYSYDLGGWHIVVLNSNCAEVGGCGSGSRQQQWLRADLAAHPARCTLAYWHHPLFTSGLYRGKGEEIRAIWQALYDAGTDVIVTGHEHHYERFAPQTPAGAPDTRRGIRQFIAGTGGKSLRPIGAQAPNSEVRDDTTHGLLKLTLHSISYAWEFVPVTGQSFRDQGLTPCS